MAIVGIIAEYNPFHAGHAYQLQQAKASVHADAVIVVMSGFFTQRGIPALIQPWQRAQAALQQGADLILQLPVVYSCANADRFANGGVSLLSQLPGITHLSFGCEAPNPSDLLELSHVLTQDATTAAAKQLQSLGNNHAKTQMLAIEALPQYAALASLMQQPNNTLALAYLQAIERQHSHLIALPIQRQGAGYLDSTLQPMASATAIRKTMEEGNIAILKEYLPSCSFEILQAELAAGQVIYSLRAFEQAILLLLRSASPAELAQLPELSEGLENRFYANHNADSLEHFLRQVKTKRYTYSRLQRSLCHLLLQIGKKAEPLYEGPAQYASVLGYNSTGQALLSQWRKKTKLPLITQPQKQMRELSAQAAEMLRYDLLAADLWRLGIADKTARSQLHWDQKQPVSV